MTNVKHSCGMRKPGASPAPVVSLINDQPRTLSTDVAAYFDKRHDHILRQIRSLVANCPAEFTAPNFGVSNYVDTSGKRNEHYSLTKDGFTLLAMGFTGPKALKFKLAYIEAFNKMESELKRRMPGERMPADPLPSAAPEIPVNLSDIVHMGNAIDYSRTLRQMARLKNYSPSQRLGFLAEAASVLSGRPADQYLPEQFDPADVPDTIIFARREKQTRQDAEALAAQIEDREREGLPHLPLSRAGSMLFRWGTKRTARATEYALENGMLMAIKKSDGNGWHLAPPESAADGKEG